MIVVTALIHQAVALPPCSVYVLAVKPDLPPGGYEALVVHEPYRPATPAYTPRVEQYLCDEGDVRELEVPTTHQTLVYQQLLQRAQSATSVTPITRRLMDLNFLQNLLL